MNPNQATAVCTRLGLLAASFATADLPAARAAQLLSALPPEHARRAVDLISAPGIPRRGGKGLLDNWLALLQSNDDPQPDSDASNPLSDILTAARAEYIGIATLASLSSLTFR